jgi:hypothetical protein
MADKRLERIVLDRFRLSLAGQFPTAEPVAGEEPDFVAGHTGIELGDVVDQKMRHGEEAHKEMVRLARQAYERQGPTFVPVLVVCATATWHPDRSTEDRCQVGRSREVSASRRTTGGRKLGKP